MMATKAIVRRAELAVLKAAMRMDDEGPGTDLNTWDAHEVICAIRKLRKLKETKP
jgi:hypothetical protein